MPKRPIIFPPTVHTVGDAIRYLREQRGLTLRALADKIGISAPFLSDLERNRRSTERLDDFATALDVPADALLRFDGRLSQELRDWISRDPAFVRFLDEQRERGVEPKELRETLVAAVSRKG